MLHKEIWFHYQIHLRLHEEIDKKNRDRLNPEELWQCLQDAWRPSYKSTMHSTVSNENHNWCQREPTRSNWNTWLKYPKKLINRCPMWSIKRKTMETNSTTWNGTKTRAKPTQNRSSVIIILINSALFIRTVSKIKSYFFNRSFKSLCSDLRAHLLLSLKKPFNGFIVLFS